MSEVQQPQAAPAEIPREQGERPERGERGDRRERRPRDQEEEWVPTTRLGRLVKAGKVSSINEIFKFSIPVKEPEIIDYFFKDSPLQEEVVNIKSVQKQTTAGQRTRFRANAIVGNRDGYIGYGSGVSSEVASAIKKAVKNAKLNLIPVRRGYWGGKLGDPHTVSSKLSGKCGSVRCRLIPAPRGSGIVASSTVSKVLEFAGISDVFTRQSGHSRTTMNSVGAVYAALKSSYQYLTPDLWAPQPLEDDIRSMITN